MSDQEIIELLETLEKEYTPTGPIYYGPNL